MLLETLRYKNYKWKQFRAFLREAITNGLAGETQTSLCSHRNGKTGKMQLLIDILGVQNPSTVVGEWKGGAENVRFSEKSPI